MLQLTQETAAWLGRLVQIPSVNPDQVGPRSGLVDESTLAHTLAGWLRSLGAEVMLEEVLPRRPNLYALWPGQSSRLRAADVHLDTVGVEQMHGDPFSGHIADGRVYGRGAVDTKASLAIILALIEALQARGRPLPHPFLLACTVDEEVEARGAPAFAAWVRRRGLQIDQLLVAEPTLCRPVYGHKGLVRLGVTIHGQPAHSSQPQRGKNAIEAAMPIVAACVAEQMQLQQRSPKLGPPQLTVTRIHGGVGANIVPDRCRLDLDRRVAEDESSATVSEQLSEMVAAACPLPLETQIVKRSDAFWQPPEDPFVQAMAAWSGEAATVAPYGTNAWAYNGLAKSCLVFGPGSIDQAHGVEEWVSLAELEKAQQVYQRWWEVADV